ncbi:MAG: DNA polymerase III subunit gamma/tau [Filifactoraceae bacterium]
MHKALYRIYRPKNFKDIIGQSHIVKVLENQIKTSTLSHAYLFTGPRGTGKTSTAKVFAKAINCIGDEKPCYKCNICYESDMDILELDAASNNSVDNIREIRDTVSFSPNVGAYKIYIVDEVHMLSGGAFNALLKTLEEPPAHVIFILATTEPHKIPQTVLSRCQRFDFKKIDQEAAKGLLIEVLDKEGHAYTDEGIEFIVKKSEGGMRDALMLLDKGISFGEINMENLQLALGELSQNELFDFVKIIEEKSVEKALTFIENIDKKGVDLKVFLMDVIEYLRDKMMENLGVFKGEEASKITLNPDKIAAYIESLCEVYSQLKYTPLPKLFLQANLVKLLNQGTNIIDINEIKELREEIARLKIKIADLEKNGLKVATSNERQKERPVVKNKPRILPEISEELSPKEEDLIEKYKDMLIEVVKMLKQEKQAPMAAFFERANIGRVIDNKIILVYNETDRFFKEALEKSKIHIAEDLWKKKHNEEIRFITAFKNELPNYKAEENHDSTLEMLREAFPDTEIEIKH